MSVLPTTVPSKTLAQNLSSSGTTLYLSNTLSWDGVQLTSADFGTQLFAVLRNPSNTQLELIELDPATIDSTSTITILKRGLPYSGGQTANTETKYDWSGSTTICELGSDTPQLLAQLVEEAGAETIAGVKTFSSIPKTTGGNASDDNELVRYAQALSLLTAGTYSQNRVVLAGTAGETLAAGNLVYLKIADGRWWKCDADTAATVENIILGIAQGAGTAGNAVTSGVLLFGLDSNQTGLTANTKYYASNTAGGLSSSAGTTEVSIGFTLSTTTIVFWPRYDQQLTEAAQDVIENLTQAVLPYAADAGASDAYAVTLSPAPTAYTAGMVVNFKANTINTGAATLNVNALGAKTIVKSYNVTLADGDIKANQVVSVVYDGTNFQLLSPVTAPSYISGMTTRDMTAASGAVTVAHGLGETPNRIKIIATIGATASCVGTYDGTNHRVIYEKASGTGNGNDTNNTIWLEPTAGDTQKAVATVDGTNITLTWTKANAPAGTAQILWEAFG